MSYQTDDPFLRAELDLFNAKYKAFAEEVATLHGIEVSLLFAIMSRETDMRNIIGDGGDGFGLMQIDRHSFPEFCANVPRALDPRENILMGASVLAHKRDFLSHNTKLEDDALLRASIAAYNCGEGNVLSELRAGLDVDTYTTKHNYSRDVLDRQDWYNSVVS